LKNQREEIYFHTQKKSAFEKINLVDNLFESDKRVFAKNILQ